jgi:pilus assembly protein FimV
MTRQLLRLFSLIILFSTGSLAFALGVGEAKVKSSLNQPLEAEIELTGVGDLSEAEILPGLAAREEFDRAGVDRVYFLSDLRFEVIWPSGRLLREYALLIDPPVFSSQPAAPVRVPGSSGAASAPVNAAQPAITSAPIRGDRVALPAPVSVAAQPVGSLAAGASYGPTRGDDTLWEIAEKARPDRSVSPQQVMLAFLEANPDAFINGNINKLREGVVLRVPERSEMVRRSKYDAINEVIAQNEALRPPRTKSVVSTQKPQSTQTADRSAAPSVDELKLLVANSGSSQSSSANSGKVDSGTGSVSRDELALTLEKLDQAVSEKNELSGKVEDLEEQLQTLQRLLTLKNDQLATLQEQMRASAQAAEKAAGQQPVAGAPTGDDPAMGMEPSDVLDQSSVPEPVPQEAESVASSVPKNEPAPVVETTAPPAEKPDAAKRNLDRLSLIERVFVDPLYMAGAGIVVVLLMVLVWSLSRSNARKEEALRNQAPARDEEILDEQTDESASYATQAESAEADQAESALESSREAEREDYFGDVDLGLADGRHDQVAADDERQTDVVAEADVYIAYGRLDQAATILEDAIAAEPVRTDLRLKILEVYKESGQTEPFERHFSELEAIQDQSALELAAQLRTELYDRELMALEDDDFDVGTDKREIVEEDREFDRIGAEAAALDEPDTTGLAHDEDLEREVLESFDFDQVDDLDQSDDELANIAEDELDLDLELSESVTDDRDESFEAELTLDLDDASPDDLDQELDIDLDLDLDQEETAADDALASDLDLSDIELSEELEQEKEIDITEDLNIPDELTADELPVPAADEVRVSDDILAEAEDAFRELDETDADLDDDEEFDFLDGADEASTKLDLARAYIDMGDLDGARDILEEVAKEGNSDQQKEARALIDELGD